MLPVVMESGGVLKKRMNAQNIANVQRFLGAFICFKNTANTPHIFKIRITPNFIQPKTTRFSHEKGGFPHHFGIRSHHQAMISFRSSNLAVLSEVWSCKILTSFLTSQISTKLLNTTAKKKSVHVLFHQLF